MARQSPTTIPSLHDSNGPDLLQIYQSPCDTNKNHFYFAFSPTLILNLSTSCRATQRFSRRRYQSNRSSKLDCICSLLYDSAFYSFKISNQYFETAISFSSFQCQSASLRKISSCQNTDAFCPLSLCQQACKVAQSDCFWVCRCSIYPSYWHIVFLSQLFQFTQKLILVSNYWPSKERSILIGLFFPLQSSLILFIRREFSVSRILSLCYNACISLFLDLIAEEYY